MHFLRTKDQNRTYRGYLEGYQNVLRTFNLRTLHLMYVNLVVKLSTGTSLPRVTLSPVLSPLSTNPIKSSNTLKTFVSNSYIYYDIFYHNTIIFLQLKLNEKICLLIFGLRRTVADILLKRTKFKCFSDKKS